MSATTPTADAPIFSGENISNYRFVAFDTETTGSSPSSDCLVELAASSFDEDFEQRRFSMLVRPPRPIPPVVVKVHGIDDAMVADAPAAAEVLERFFEFLELVGTPRVLLAHNAGFDVGMINAEWKRRPFKCERALGGPEIVLDTCMLAKALLPELEHHRLEAVVSHFKIESGRLHRAGEDARVLREVFMKLLGLAADRIATREQELTLSALVDLCGGYFVLDPKNAEARRAPFRFSPRIAALEPLCGTDARVAIVYENSHDYRYITPLAIKLRGLRVYVEAFCHRESMKKTFRADRILRVGRVEEASC